MSLDATCRYVFNHAKEIIKNGGNLRSEHVLFALLEYMQYDSYRLKRIDRDSVLENQLTQREMRALLNNMNIDCDVMKKHLAIVINNKSIYDYPDLDAANIETLTRIASPGHRTAPGELAGLMSDCLTGSSETVKSILGLISPDRPAPEAVRPVVPTEAATVRSLASLSRFTRDLRAMTVTLKQCIFGQDHAIDALTAGLFAAEIFSTEIPQKRGKPKAVFTFAGAPGVGKTYLASQAAELLGIPCMRLDMSSFTDKHADAALQGVPVYYKHPVRGRLTEFVEKNPVSVIIIDEIEKAHINAVNLFLQILQGAVLQDQMTQEYVDFSQTIFVFTTNAGRSLYENAEGELSALPRRTVINALITDADSAGKPLVPPPIASRLSTGHVIMFNNMKAYHLEKIIRSGLERCSKDLMELRGVPVEIDPLLPSALLLTGLTDARNAAAAVEKFFSSELQKLFALFSGEHLATRLEEIKRLHFVIDSEARNELQGLFTLEAERILLFTDEAFFERFRSEAGSHTLIRAEATETFLEQTEEVNLILLDPLMFTSQHNEARTVQSFDHIPVTAASLKDCWNFFKHIREYHPGIAVYLLDRGSPGLDPELRDSFLGNGARGVLETDGDLGENLNVLLRNLSLQNTAQALSDSGKAVSFETAPLKEGSDVYIRLRNLTVGRIVSVEDMDSLLSSADMPSETFDDVFGAGSAKTELRHLAEALKKPGAGPKELSILLYGPPGNGKTMLARAFAHESGAAFIAVNAGSFVTYLAGSGPEAVRKLFAQARKYAPCIVFIDEIDSIGVERGSTVARAEEMTLIALLTEMDGFKKNASRRVYVLAATNLANRLDAALLRRFGRRILIDRPSLEERYGFLKAKTADFSVSEEILELLASRSFGMGMADLVSFLKNARRHADMSGSPVTDKTLLEAFETFKHGDAGRPQKEYLQAVAVHEAGHALISYLNGNVPDFISLTPRSNTMGYVETPQASPVSTKDELLGRIRVSLAGRAAELLYFGENLGLSTGSSGDILAATSVARDMVCKYGMSSGIGCTFISEEDMRDPKISYEVHTAVRGITGREFENAQNELSCNRARLDKLVDALTCKNTLTRSEISALLGE